MSFTKSMYLANCWTFNCWAVKRGVSSGRMCSAANSTPYWIRHIDGHRKTQLVTERTAKHSRPNKIYAPCSTCLSIELATPRVHMRVGAEWSTAVQRWIVCKISKQACLSSIETSSPKHSKALTRTCQGVRRCYINMNDKPINPKGPEQPYGQEHISFLINSLVKYTCNIRRSREHNPIYNIKGLGSKFILN